MKQTLSAVAFMLLTMTVHAQHDVTKPKKKGIQNVQIGLIVDVSAHHVFKKEHQEEKLFEAENNVLASTSLSTSKTYCNFMYGFDKSFHFWGGYILPKEFDVYIAYVSDFESRGKYTGLGFEKIIKVGHVIDFCMFTEVGTNFKGSGSLSCGLLVSVQNMIWKRH